MKMIKMFCEEFFNRCIIPIVLILGSFLFAIAFCSTLLAIMELI